MKNLCNHCPYGKLREECDTLCPEAEAWANKDHIGREKAFNIPGIKAWRGTIQTRVPTDYEGKAREVKILRKQGYSYRDISIHVECSLSFIHRVLSGKRFS